jgi:hypothetical protein
MALFKEKDGFSVVAPIKTMVPRSQSNRRASWNRLEDIRPRRTKTQAYLQPPKEEHRQRHFVE